MWTKSSLIFFHFQSNQAICDAKNLGSPTDSIWKTNGQFKRCSLVRVEETVFMAVINFKTLCHRRRRHLKALTIIYYCHEMAMIESRPWRREIVPNHQLELNTKRRLTWVTSLKADLMPAPRRVHSKATVDNSFEQLWPKVANPPSPPLP